MNAILSALANGLAWIIREFRNTKSLLMVQNRCLGSFETNRRLSLERTYHNTVCPLPGNF